MGSPEISDKITETRWNREKDKVLFSTRCYIKRSCILKHTYVPQRFAQYDFKEIASKQKEHERGSAFHSCYDAMLIGNYISRDNI